jgi:hypothetical protein
MSCVDCNQVLNCLKTINDGACSEQCTIFFKLLDCDTVFFGGEEWSVKSIVINGLEQPVPEGTFNSSSGLADLLAGSGWLLNSQYETNFYVNQSTGPFTGDSQIVFRSEDTNKV